jgi:hypothetical protein
MRIADVCGLSLDDVLERVDLMDAIAVDQWLETHPALPNCKEPWPHDNPPIGTWRLDPVFGQFEVLVWVDPCEVVITEGDHEAARSWPESALYRDWLRAGRMPPAISVVRHADGPLHTQNRRRTLAARDVGAPRIPAWFSETIPTGAPRWRSMWLGAVYWDAYATLGPIVFTDAY